MDELRAYSTPPTATVPGPLRYGSLGEGAANVNQIKAPRETTLLDALQKDVSNLRDQYGQITQRLVAALDRATGPQPMGGQTNGSARPAQAGAFQVIGETISDLRAIAELLNEQVARVERIT